MGMSAEHDDTVQLDSVDAQILALLRHDGRAAYSAIAKSVGVSKSTVRKRMDRMIDAGAILVTAHVRPTAVDRPVDVVIAVKARPGRIQDVGETLAEYEEVCWLAYVMGDCDIFVEAYLQSPNALLQFLDGRVGKVDGIESFQGARVIANESRTGDWPGERANLLLPLSPDETANEVQPHATEDVTLPRTLVWDEDNSPCTTRVDLDDLDRLMIQALRHDGRMRYAELARILGVSNSTARNRFERLIEHKVISITIRVNAAAIGLGTAAFIQLRVKRGKVRELGRRLATIPFISEVGYVAASYDLYLEAKLPDALTLYNLIDDELATDDIERINVLHVLRTLKINYMWPGESLHVSK